MEGTTLYLLQLPSLTLKVACIYRGFSKLATEALTQPHQLILCVCPYSLPPLTVINHFSKEPQFSLVGKGIQYPVWELFGEGNGTPLQYSCLENPMDREAW